MEQRHENSQLAAWTIDEGLMNQYARSGSYKTCAELASNPNIPTSLLEYMTARANHWEVMLNAVKNPMASPRVYHNAIQSQVNNKDAIVYEVLDRKNCIFSETLDAIMCGPLNSEIAQRILEERTYVLKEGNRALVLLDSGVPSVVDLMVDYYGTSPELLTTIARLRYDEKIFLKILNHPNAMSSAHSLSGVPKVALDSCELSQGESTTSVYGVILSQVLEAFEGNLSDELLCDNAVVIEFEALCRSSKNINTLSLHENFSHQVKASRFEKKLRGVDQDQRMKMVQEEEISLYEACQVCALAKRLNEPSLKLAILDNSSLSTTDRVQFTMSHLDELLAKALITNSAEANSMLLEETWKATHSVPNAFFEAIEKSDLLGRVYFDVSRGYLFSEWVKAMAQGTYPMNEEALLRVIEEHSRKLSPLYQKTFRDAKTCLTEPILMMLASKAHFVNPDGVHFVYMLLQASKNRVAFTEILLESEHMNGKFMEGAFHLIRNQFDYLLTKSVLEKFVHHPSSPAEIRDHASAALLLTGKTERELTDIAFTSKNAEVLRMLADKKDLTITEGIVENRNAPKHILEKCFLNFTSDLGIALAIIKHPAVTKALSKKVAQIYDGLEEERIVWELIPLMGSKYALNTLKRYKHNAAIVCRVLKEKPNLNLGDSSLSHDSYCESAFEGVRVAYAQSEMADPVRLHLLSGDASALVRVAVAMNRNTPRKGLQKILNTEQNDNSVYMRYALEWIITHPNASLRMVRIADRRLKKLSHSSQAKKGFPQLGVIEDRKGNPFYLTN